MLTELELAQARQAKRDAMNDLEAKRAASKDEGERSDLLTLQLNAREQLLAVDGKNVDKIFDVSPEAVAASAKHWQEVEQDRREHAEHSRLQSMGEMDPATYQRGFEAREQRRLNRQKASATLAGHSRPMVEGDTGAQIDISPLH